MASSSSKKRINTGRYLFSAFLYVIRIPLALLSIAAAIYAVIQKETDLLILAGVITAITILSCLIFFWKSGQVACRLCRANFLRNLKCSVKSHAPKALGSHTLPVALAILARKERIRCPYCGEKHPYFYKD